jgi:hypothetical protein
VQVSVQLEGEQGSFGPIPMDTDRTGKLFNAKAVDTFVRVCPPLGELVQASVKNAPCDSCFSWPKFEPGANTSVVGRVTRE